ncbi:MAG TPA: flagellar assembly protein FliH [Treponema sp.]|nr:flagellar assembly protein FliH [Treponema sp.]
MAKNVFRANEVKLTNDHVQLRLSKTFVEEVAVEEVIEVPQYEGPTADDLRREAEQWKLEWEATRENIIEETNLEAQQILDKAQKAAFDEVKRKTDQAQIVRQEAQDEAENLLISAREEAEAVLADAQKRVEEQEKTGHDEGFKKGREEGFREGNLEAERLVERLHTIVERTMDKRQEILSETEQQIVDLVLLMTRKIVKVISENQRNVVVSNVIQALRKVKGRGDVIIRVNLNDVGMTTQHTKDFLAAAENVKNITVVEDSTVDRGGCLIETDFGAIDAKIVSQLNELEQRILEVSPIKTRLKTATSAQQD